MSCHTKYLFAHLLLSAPRRCASPLDIAFIIDGSKSMGFENYLKEKEYVKTMAAVLEISEAGSHAAVIVYSRDGVVEIDFRQGDDLKRFNQKMDSLRFYNQETRIDKALIVAESQLFNSRGGHRRQVPKVVVLLVDGRTTVAKDSVPLGRASQPLKDIGAKIFVVGVGNNFDKNEMAAVATSPNNIFAVGGFDELLPSIATIISKTCEASGMLTIENNSSMN